MFLKKTACNESVVTISYKIFFFDSARFTRSSLSIVVNNLAEEINKIKCKDCNCFSEYESVNDNLLKYQYLSCNENCSDKFDKKLNKKIKNAFQLSNLFCLYLWRFKGA